MMMKTPLRYGLASFSTMLLTKQRRWLSPPLSAVLLQVPIRQWDVRAIVMVMVLALQMGVVSAIQAGLAIHVTCHAAHMTAMVVECVLMKLACVREDSMDVLASTSVALMIAPARATASRAGASAKRVFLAKVVNLLLTRGQ